MQVNKTELWNQVLTNLIPVVLDCNGYDNVFEITLKDIKLISDFEKLYNVKYPPTIEELGFSKVKFKSYSSKQREKARDYYCSFDSVMNKNKDKWRNALNKLTEDIQTYLKEKINT